MLRSFSYARATALAGVSDHAQSELAGWERTERQCFLDAYLQVVNDSGLTLFPNSQDEFMGAVKAWEIDKALYEVMYELSSRPAWLWLPLSSLIQYG